MKKIHIILFTACMIISSCGTEEETPAPPSNIVQTPEPEPTAPEPEPTTPDPVQYTLTVSAGDGGTVSTEGGTYDEGTEVTVTATPAEGYEFVGWDGSDSDSSSLTITISSNLEINANFLQDKVTLKVSLLNSSYSNMSEVLEDEQYLTLGMLNFKDNGLEHLIFSSCDGRACEVKYLPTFHFYKDLNGNWQEESYYENINMTFCGKDVQKLAEGEYIWVDHGQETYMAGCPENKPFGTIYIGKNFSETGIDWTRVDEDLGFWHDIFVDDIDLDGDLDFVTTVLTAPEIDKGLHVFLNENGNFSRKERIFSYDGIFFRDDSPNSPFFDCFYDSKEYTDEFGSLYCPSYSIGGVAISDLDGDGGKEIIASSYKVNESELPEGANANRTFEIYSDKNSDGVFELLKVIPPIGVKQNPHAAIVETFPYDVDNDGDNDIVAYFENNVVNWGTPSNEIPYNLIQIFFNDGNANFSYTGQEFKGTFPVWASISKFSMIDFDNDGDLDVIADSHLFPEYDITNIAEYLAGEADNFIVDFDQYIWVNDNGSFSVKDMGFEYSLDVEGNPEEYISQFRGVKPYFIDNKLKFVSLRAHEPDKLKIYEFYLNN